MNPQAKTYRGRMIAIAIAYTASVIGMNLADMAWELSQPVRIGLSLVPVIAAFLMLPTILAFIRSWDEVQQRIITEAALMGSAVVGFGTFTYGFLLGAIDLPTIHPTLILPALILTTSLAHPLVRRRYL